MIGLVLAIALVLLAVPIGASAAGSLVTIVDSSTTTKARVDSATNALRVGGITNKVIDRTGTQNDTFTFNAAPYSQLRIFADHQGCSGFCDTLTVECVENGARTCTLVPTQSFDQTGYNVFAGIPGRTVRVKVQIQFGVGTWHVVIYGRTP